MKILAIGDFHGRFPDKLKSLIKKENLDLIFSTGDYAGVDEFRPALKKMFKLAAQGKEFSYEDYFGKEKYKKLLKKDFESGKLPLKEINKFGIPVFSVFGNGDWYNWERGDKRRLYENEVKKLRNIADLNRASGNFRGLKISGFGGYLDPDIYFTEKGIKAINSSEENASRRKARYDKWENQMMKITKGADIVLAHYTPYKCLDVMKEKGFMLSGENMGVSSYNRVIKKYKPALLVCGHMHENQGKCKINATLVVNPGAALEGKAAIIDFDEKMKRVLSVRFVR